MTDVLALVDDLFFQAKLSQTAQQLGVKLKMVTTGDALTSSAGSDLPRLVLVDLNARQGAIEAIERLNASGDSGLVIAFLSHVQTELAERARAAGCRRVLPRSKFTAELADILQQAKM